MYSWGRIENIETYTTETNENDRNKRENCFESDSSLS